MLRGQAIGLLGLGLLTGTAICQSERFLDLTKLVRPSNDNAPSGGSVASSLVGETGQPAVKPSPLRVTLLSLDKRSYYWGEKFVADVRVENAGDQPVAFPSTLDSRFANPGVSKPKSLLTVLITPITDPDSSRVNKSVTDGWTEVAVLYGSTDLPQTFVMVQPRETVRIRFASKVLPERHRFPLKLAVKVRVSFVNGPLSGNNFSGNNYWPAVSENSIPITVREEP